MTPPRFSFALFLATVLVLTSGTMAMVRGQTAVAGEIVICTGHGPVSIFVDVDGNPAGPAHYCPDCALSLFAAHMSVAATVGAVDWQRASYLVPVRAARFGLSVPRATARGPPPPLI